MLFAELTAEGWAIVIGAIGLIVTKVVSMILDYRREKDRVVREAKATAQRIDLAEKIEQVHIATNSMKDALVITTEKEALARGEAKGRVDEKAEQDAKRLE